MGNGQDNILPHFQQRIVLFYRFFQAFPVPCLYYPYSGKHASAPHLGREIGITGEAEWSKAVFDCEVTIEDDV